MSTFAARLVVLGCILAAAFACGAASAGPFDTTLEGRVTEHEGGKPVADVWVFATWWHQGADPVGSRTSCLRVEITRTDEAGRFSIPLPAFGAEPGVQVFKPKYKQYFAKDTLPDAEIYAANRQVEVVPFAGTGEDRRQLYAAIHGLLRCRSDNVIQTVRPLYEAVDKEAAQLGVRGNFVKSLEWLQRDLDAERQRQERQK
jgi:hypothetical protein